MKKDSVSASVSNVSIGVCGTCDADATVRLGTVLYCADCWSEDREIEQLYEEWRAQSAEGVRGQLRLAEQFEFGRRVWVWLVRWAWVPELVALILGGAFAGGVLLAALIDWWRQ